MPFSTAPVRQLAPAHRGVVLACGAVMAIVVATQAAQALLGLHGGGWTQLADAQAVLVGLTASAACAIRARLLGEERGAWTLLAVALALYSLGCLAWRFWLDELPSPPYPSPADALWLPLYPVAYVTLGLLLRPRFGRFPAGVWMDGLIAALAVAALGVAFVYGPMLQSIDGADAAAVATSLAYPLGDVLLLGFVAGAFALSGWRPGREWLLLGAGFAAFAVADIVYLNRVAGGELTMQGVPNLGWAAGLALLGFGAWQQPSLRVRFEGVPVLVVPALFTLTATGLLVYDHFAPLNVASVLLAAATLAVAVLRTALSFREVRQLAESRREALTDDLTGLANRRHFFLRLEEALRHADRRLGVLVLDLDDFKELNDTLGHHAGDLLLEEVAARLPRCVRVHDMLARLGGDEFAVLLVDAGPEEARAAADRVRAAIGRPYELEGIQLALDASVGVALFPDSATTAQGLVQRADVAMYQAKASRSGTELYTESRDARSRERLALSGELRRSIEEDELVLHYQPICDPRTGRPVATEALVRWLHPERGLLMPGDFLDLAERAGTMRDLTLWVMRAAIGQAREWREAGLPVRMSVNLSPQDLLDLRFADDVADALDSVHLSADAVTFEITEDTIMADPLRGMDILRDLGDLGVGLALDDFGTGYSSLAHLKRLPVEELKIDRSFVSRMVEEHDDGVIVRSTIELARSLRLRVVAEGVEDLATWTRLTELGCDLIQGFGVSRPLPAAEATAWLAARRDSVRPAA